jgi:hypothetical protein
MDDRVTDSALRSSRRAGLSGLAFIVITVVVFALTTGPEANASDQAILDFFSDSTTQVTMIAGTVLTGAAGLAFLAFVTSLRALLISAGSDDWWTQLAYGSGLVCAGLIFVTLGVGGSAIAATYQFSDDFELDPQTARLFLFVGETWLAAAIVVAFVPLIFGTSLTARRAGLLPSWLTWFGFVIAALGLLSAPMFGAPIFLVALWVLLVSIVLLRRRTSSSSPEILIS